MWLDRLKELKKASGFTTKEISDRSGLPGPTLEKIFAGSTKDPKLETMRCLVYSMGFTLDDLIETPGKNGRFTPIEQGIIKKYRALDEHGKEMVTLALDCETRRVEASKEPPAAEKPAMKVIPLFGTSFAAGTSEPESDIPWEKLEVDADSKAEFAIHINGNSMEPYLHDGSIAYGVKRSPRDGEVAALLLDGDFICKQVCQDFVGNLYLFALNRARKDADQQIMHDEDRSVTCFGTILMDPVPLPRNV